MNYNAANEQQIKERKEKVQTQRDQELEDIKYILSVPPGIRFFRRFFEDAKMFNTTFTGNSHTFFLEGHRNLALIYFNDICEAMPHVIKDLMIKKEIIKDE